MTHVSCSSYDTCILLLIWHMYPPPHMTHVSSSSYDTCIRVVPTQRHHDACILLLIWRMYPPPHMTHVSSSSYDACILLLIWRMYPPPHMKHVSSSSYDACILLLIWRMYPPPHMTHQKTNPKPWTPTLNPKPETLNQRGYESETPTQSHQTDAHQKLLSSQNVPKVRAPAHFKKKTIVKPECPKSQSSSTFTSTSLFWWNQASSVHERLMVQRLKVSAPSTFTSTSLSIKRNSSLQNLYRHERWVD